IGKLPTTPMVELEISRRAEQAVQAAELIGDGGVLDARIEDVDRLVLARHALAILPLVVTAPRWLPEREEGKLLWTQLVGAASGTVIIMVTTNCLKCGGSLVTHPPRGCASVADLRLVASPDDTSLASRR